MLYIILLQCYFNIRIELQKDICYRYFNSFIKSLFLCNETQDDYFSSKLSLELQSGGNISIHLKPWQFTCL